MRKERVDTEFLSELLSTHYESKAEMAGHMGIRRSHLQEVLKGKGVGSRVIEGLKQESERLGFDYLKCFIPKPMVIGEELIDEINVVGEGNELLASISSRDIIEKKGTTVIFVPYKP